MWVYECEEEVHRQEVFVTAPHCLAPLATCSRQSIARVCVKPFWESGLDIQPALLDQGFSKLPC